MSARRLSRDEIGIRDSEIYERELPSKLEATALDQFVAIDVESAEHEVADEAHLAGDRLRSRFISFPGSAWERTVFEAPPLSPNLPPPRLPLLPLPQATQLQSVELHFPFTRPLVSGTANVANALSLWR